MERLVASIEPCASLCSIPLVCTVFSLEAKCFPRDGGVELISVQLALNCVYNVFAIERLFFYVLVFKR